MKFFLLYLTFFLTILYASEKNIAVAEIKDKQNDISIQDQKGKGKKALFVHHFRILDSVINANPNDTVYGGSCFRSILFMVKNTKIEVTADVSGILGRTKFNRSDWLNWHAWYEKKYGIKKK